MTQIVTPKAARFGIIVPPHWAVILCPFATICGKSEGDASVVNRARMHGAGGQCLCRSGFPF